MEGGKIVQREGIDIGEGLVAHLNGFEHWTVADLTTGLYSYASRSLGSSVDVKLCFPIRTVSSLLSPSILSNYSFLLGLVIILLSWELAIHLVHCGCNK